jgi:hypothetical protein
MENILPMWNLMVEKVADDGKENLNIIFAEYG